MVTLLLKGAGTKTRYFANWQIKEEIILLII